MKKQPSFPSECIETYPDSAFSEAGDSLSEESADSDDSVDSESDIASVGSSRSGEEVEIVDLEKALEESCKLSGPWQVAFDDGSHNTSDLDSSDVDSLVLARRRFNKNRLDEKTPMEKPRRRSPTVRQRRLWRMIVSSIGGGSPVLVRARLSRVLNFHRDALESRSADCDRV